MRTNYRIDGAEAVGEPAHRQLQGQAMSIFRFEGTHNDINGIDGHAVPEKGQEQRSRNFPLSLERASQRPVPPNIQSCFGPNGQIAGTHHTGRQKHAKVRKHGERGNTGRIRGTVWAAARLATPLELKLTMGHH